MAPYTGASEAGERLRGIAIVPPSRPDARAQDEPLPTALLARSGRWWMWLLRLAISIVMVWFLVRKIAGAAFTDLLPPWDQVSLPYLAGALVLTALSIVLASARWTQVLHALERTVPFPRLVAHYFAGQFVSNVLPTTIGGDVLRGARLTADTGDGADSAASLIIERLTGWLVLPLLTIAGLVLSPDVRASGQPATVALAIALGTLAGLVVILYVADHARLGGRFLHGDPNGHRARRRWVDAAQRFLTSVHLGVGRLRRHPPAAAGVVGVGIVYQLVLVLAAVAAARALGLDLPPAAMVAVFPVVLMVQVLPIGISGVGIREWALVFFLVPLGVPDERAVGLGILVFLLNLLVSLLGAPAFARPLPPLATGPAVGTGDAGRATVPASPIDAHPSPQP
jgi:uncharacterized protein (TIRG00374 family)